MAERAKELKDARAEIVGYKFQLEDAKSELEDLRDAVKTVKRERKALCRAIAVKRARLKEMKTSNSVT